MNNRPFRWLLSSLLICPLLLSAQIKTKHLKGSWFTSNADSLYYKADTLHLFQDSQHFNSTKGCQMVEWHFEKRTLSPTHFNHCTSRAKLGVWQEFSLHKEDFGQVLTLSQNGKVVDQFKVLDFLKKCSRQGSDQGGYLRLQRFDRPEEHKLYQGVDSLARTVFQEQADTVTTSRSMAYSKPLLIINGTPIGSYEILKEFSLIELSSIHFIHRQLLPGCKPITGVIVLRLPTEKFERVQKLYNSL